MRFCFKSICCRDQGACQLFFTHPLDPGKEIKSEVEEESDPLALDKNEENSENLPQKISQEFLKG